MEYRDYYKTLGVPRTASQAEIKKAFRKLAREHHPDRNAGDKTAEKRFKDVNEAHAVLSDPDKRKRYDSLGADWERFQRTGGPNADPFGPGGPFAGYAWAGEPAGGGGRSGNVRYEFHSSGDAAGFSDFFRTVFGGGAQGDPRSAGGRGAGARGGAATEATLEEMLAGMGLGLDPAGSRPRSTTTRRSHAEATAELTLEEAFTGTTRLIEIDGKRLEITIPRGVDTGTRIRLSGKGPGGGDLVVVPRVRPHAVFRRKGPDLERDLPITLREALLGADVPVTTLKGRVLLTIPPETQNGRTFRLRGQGMPRFRGDGSGDLYVKTRVVLPSGLSGKAQAAAEQLFELVDQPDPRTARTSAKTAN
jgi:curved DNA-binding protein